jgi:taurine dioxygenase
MAKVHPGPRPVQPTYAADERKAYRRIVPEPMSPTIGAEIGGVSLRQPIDEATFDELHRALLEYKVIFFRDQDITPEQHVAFARRFGELETHPFVPHRDGHPEVMVLRKNDKMRGYENVWHSDVTWRQEPSLGSVLLAREVPPIGGDTLFCDMYAAYDGLSERMRASLEGLRAVHDFTRTFAPVLSAEDLAKKQKEFPPAEHPVVRTHPETGRKGLYVNAAFTSHIVGMTAEESDRLLDRLYREATVPEYQCRFRWRRHSIAFWDNRAVQHYANSDYYPQPRLMERVTIIGDRPR